MVCSDQTQTSIRIPSPPSPPQTPRRIPLRAVDLYTGHHDRSRCFPETLGGYGFSVVSAGTWFPRAVFGRLVALCSLIRCALVALHVAARVRAGAAAYDVVLCDQVSLFAWLVRVVLGAPVLFYCHFPDLLLSERNSWAKSLYRAPIDWLEEHTTGAADRILVNSNFTGTVFARAGSAAGDRGRGGRVE